LAGSISNLKCERFEVLRGHEHFHCSSLRCACMYQVVGTGNVEEHTCMIRVEVNQAGAVPGCIQAGGANRQVTDDWSKQ
jgi:hypothetical protein